MGTSFDDIEDMERRAITWLIMAISPLCSKSLETRGTSGEDYIEMDDIENYIANSRQIMLIMLISH